MQAKAQGVWILAKTEPTTRALRLRHSLNNLPRQKVGRMTLTPRRGTWYIVVTCENCKLTVFLFRDLKDGKRALEGKYVVTCPRCGYRSEYEGRHYCHEEDS